MCNQSAPFAIIRLHSELRLERSLCDDQNLLKVGETDSQPGPKEI